MKADVLVTRDGEIVCAKGGTVPLAPRMCEVLQVLADRHGHFVSRQEMVRRIYGAQDGPLDLNIISVFLTRLRKRMAPHPCTFQIEHRDSYGWRIRGELRVQS